MRAVLVVLAALLWVPALPDRAAPAAALEKEPAFQENLFGVHVRGSRAWIVGYYGTILHSEDRGQTWEIQPSPTRNALYRVQFLDDRQGWISGSYGTLIRTVDGGKSWRAQPTGTSEHLFGLTWANNDFGWAVGSRGTILRTRGGGRSWIDSSIQQDLILSSVSFLDTARGWVVGEFGVIFATQDGGENWIKQHSPVEVSFASGESRNLFALLFSGAEGGWAFGLDGVVLKTQSGSRWEIARKNGEPGESSRRHHLYAASSFNGRLWAVGERGTLLHYSGNGSDWQKAKTRVPPLTLNGIAFGEDGFGLVVGNRGLILRTTDGGATWQALKIVTRSAGKGASQAR